MYTDKNGYKRLTKEEINNLHRMSMKSIKQTQKNIIDVQTKEIKKLYENLYQEVKTKAERLEGINSVSIELQKIVLNDIAKDIERKLKDMGVKEESIIIDGVTGVSEAMAEEGRKIAELMGFKVTGDSFMSIPKDVIENIYTGNIYKDNKYLSDRIWGHSKKVYKDIQEIIAKGVQLGKPTYDIAKDIEIYIKPSAVKPWSWLKVYPNVNKVIDYNAQRLVRTIIHHAYQQSYIGVTKDNPFVKGYIWIANGSRVCDLCSSMNGAFFTKSSVPLDHPNGMCILQAVTEDLNDVAKQMAEWYKAEEGTYPKIDKYVKKLGA